MTNMYTRICNTYQPPLYNLLMYLWLIPFDSEFGFRLAGVIATFIGAVGVFFTLKETIKNDIWAVMGTLFYIYTPCIAYYALECAEYNLMLCCMSWTVFFYTRTIKRMDVASIIGFFIFSCLSVYSQYGAAFIILGMFMSIIGRIVKRKDVKMMKYTCFITFLVIVSAALPLICFFMIPQMNQQGSISISHFPVFINNIYADFIYGMMITLGWIFGSKSLYGQGIFICCGVGVAIIFTLVAILKKKKEIYPYILSIIIAYIVYFFAVACSFYGYNSWSGTLGCNNIGGKYAIFFVPIIIVTLVNGVRLTLLDFKQKSCKMYRVLASTFIFLIIVFSGIEIINLDCFNWKKDDVREVVNLWYENKLYNSSTLVHQWDDALVQFYLIHNKDYDKSYQDEIKTAGLWIRSADYDEMSDRLSEMGYLVRNDFYYIAPNGFEIFKKVMEDNDFSIEIIYEGNSVLLHLKKCINDRTVKSFSTK